MTPRVVPPCPLLIDEDPTVLRAPVVCPSAVGATAQQVVDACGMLCDALRPHLRGSREQRRSSRMANVMIDTGEYRR